MVLQELGTMTGHAPRSRQRQRPRTGRFPSGRGPGEGSPWQMGWHPRARVGPASQRVCWRERAYLPEEDPEVQRGSVLCSGQVGPGLELKQPTYGHACPSVALHG